MHDLLSEYVWYLEIDDIDKAKELSRDLSAYQLECLYIACRAMYIQSATAGVSPYTLLVEERSTYSNVGEELDYALLLEYCMLVDIRHMEEARLIYYQFKESTHSKLNEFLAQVDNCKPLTPQLTILRK